MRANVSEELIPISKLRANPYQARFNFTLSQEEMVRHKETKEMKKLVSSIKRRGLLQAIGVCEEPGGYVVRYGHRRVVAHMILGEEYIRAIVHKDCSAKDLALDCGAENIHRENLSMFELAMYYHRSLSNAKNMEECALENGTTKSEIFKYLKILTLDEKIIEDIKNNMSAKKDKELFYELARLDPLPNLRMDKMSFLIQWR